ncbi:hypothetical protein ACFSSA_00455 [Luteolibacter algae]|uniref:Uncharacterized protein n=1 Tax=Luteolibacter algae TaxID=454151 RepID=A0ABW5D273_9BACT
MNTSITFSGFLGLALSGVVMGMSLSERLEVTHEAFLEDRREALSGLSDPFGVPEAARVVLENPKDAFRSEYAWKRNVVTTVFWIGEQPTQNNPTPNDKSAWDQNWQLNYGGYDDPNQREGFLPKNFIPNLNPFYVALPYNDIGKDFRHRPEAAQVIPWFWERYQGEGISVCKGRWIAIHHDGRICYAQWEDVGPFETDHYQYVFGNENARSNRNEGAGLDISPAVRDYLKMGSGERVEWKFVEDYEVPEGPWKFNGIEPPLPIHR